MHWILFVAMFSNIDRNPAIATAEFNSILACMRAGDEVQKELPDRVPMGQVLLIMPSVKTFCLPKGETK